MLKYSDLNQVQKNFVCNGCGGKGGIIDPPEFIFNASCNQHDFYYWRGCSEEDRKIADDSFYKFMRETISKEKWYLRPHYHLWAYAYYREVRLSGKKFFHYGERMKNIGDLASEMVV